MLEHYDKEMTKVEEPIKPQWQPTLKDILNDKEKSSLFGDMLKRDNDTEIANRLAEGNLTEGDISSLEERRTTFTETMKRVESLKETITPATLEAFARNNKDFEKILKLVGPDSAVAIYKKQIAEFSISDPDRFTALANATENYNSYLAGDWKETDTFVKDELKKLNVKESSYAKALAIEDEVDRAKALRGAVREGYGWFKKTGDWLSAGALSKGKVGLLEEGKDVIDDARAKLQYYRSQVGDTLSASTEGNEIMRKALSQELVGDKMESKPATGFKEMKNSVMTESALQQQWSAYKKHNEDISKVSWEELEQDRKTMARNEFTQAQKDLYKQTNKDKTGFWGTVFGAFAEMFVSNNNNENTLN